MILKVEISEKAIKENFVKEGIMIQKDEKWVKIEFEPKELSEEEREIIVEKCDYDGWSTFTCNEYYSNIANPTVKDMLDIIQGK